MELDDAIERVIEDSHREPLNANEPLCGVCHNTRAYHEKDDVRHQFDVGGKLMSKSTPVPNSDRGVPSGDPILRLVLIRKGIISVEEIEAAEKELKALGVASVGTVARSRREDSRVDI